MRDREIQGNNRRKSLPLGSPHPSRLRRATFPQRGKAFRLGNCRGPNNHQGSALQARGEGNSDPLAGSAGKPPKYTVQISPNRPKGVLRTLVLS